MTFTAHLAEGFRLAKIPFMIRRPRPRTEIKSRDFGYGHFYWNTNLDDMDPKESHLIVCSSKKFKDEVKYLLDSGAHIVIHDPTELKYLEGVEYKHIPIVIRPSMKKNIGHYIPHPYHPLNQQRWSYKQRKMAVSISRIDFDKHTEIILDANRLLAKNLEVEIRGFENRLYTKFKIMPAYPEWRQSINAYPREFRYATKLCGQYRYMVDMSAIKNDGGGTQYTFLEAMDAGTTCILNEEWFDYHQGEMEIGKNCHAVRNGVQLTSLLRGLKDSMRTKLVMGGDAIIAAHDAKLIARRYRKYVT